MNKRKLLVTAVSASLTAFIAFGQGCRGMKGTTTGNPIVGLRFSAYEATVVAAVGAKSSTSRKPASVPKYQTMAVVDDITMCFKRLRLKVQNRGSNQGDVEMNIGEVSLSPSGTNLAHIAMPRGVFQKIELTLGDDCGTGRSIRVVNSRGSFHTDESVTLKFRGQFNTETDGDVVELIVQKLVDSLGAVGSNSQLRQAAEAIDGHY